MAKVQIKSEKITPFGGKFHVREHFPRFVDPVIDKVLGLRCSSFGYQYSEIIRAVFSVFCCGGDCMEDLNLYLKDVLSERPHTRVPSADTVLRGIEELATENISYTAEKTGNVYDFNTAEKLNQLLIKLLLAIGQLAEKASTMLTSTTSSLRRTSMTASGPTRALTATAPACSPSAG